MSFFEKLTQAQQAAFLLEKFNNIEHHLSNIVELLKKANEHLATIEDNVYVDDEEDKEE